MWYRLGLQVKVNACFLQDIDWIAGAEQDITSPHAFTHRIAHCQGPAVHDFAAEVCLDILLWLSEF